MRSQFRQGDLLFTRIEGLNKPENTKTVEDGVIARGESTGHAHRIAPKDLKQGKAKVYFMAEPRRIVIEAFEPVRVLHEEHRPITLPPGIWEVRQQREYTPGDIRYVAD